MDRHPPSAVGRVVLAATPLGNAGDASARLVDALATARRNLGGDEAPVLTGTLTVSGRSSPVSMRWWAGD